MSIRLLARDLYRIQSEVEQLMKDLAAAPYDKRNQIEEKLRKVKAEKERLRLALDGQLDR